MRFDSHLQFRVPDGVPEAVKRAAADRLISPSDYMRQMLAQQLKRDGVTIRPERQAKPECGRERC